MKLANRSRDIQYVARTINLSPVSVKRKAVKQATRHGTARQTTWTGFNSLQQEEERTKNKKTKNKKHRQAERACCRSFDFLLRSKIRARGASMQNADSSSSFFHHGGGVKPTGREYECERSALYLALSCPSCCLWGDTELTETCTSLMTSAAEYLGFHLTTDSLWLAYA